VEGGELECEPLCSPATPRMLLLRWAARPGRAAVVIAIALCTHHAYIADSDSASDWRAYMRMRSRHVVGTYDAGLTGAQRVELRVRVSGAGLRIRAERHRFRSVERSVRGSSLLDIRAPVMARRRHPSNGRAPIIFHPWNGTCAPAPARVVFVWAPAGYARPATGYCGGVRLLPGRSGLELSGSRTPAASSTAELAATAPARRHSAVTECATPPTLWLHLAFGASATLLDIWATLRSREAALLRGACSHQV